MSDDLQNRSGARSRRRQFLRALGASGAVGLAGCFGNADGGAESDTDTATDSGTSTVTETEAATVSPTPTATNVTPPAADPGPYEGNPARPPEEALDTFSLPEGWEIELVASEPLIDSPVDVKWDAKGRLYVVEMPDYMSNVPGNGEPGNPPGNWGAWGETDMSRAELSGWGDSLSDAEPNGRIARLRDVDGDGRMERAETVVGSLTVPRSIGFVDGDDHIVGVHAGQAVGEADVFIAPNSAGGDAESDREGLVQNWVQMDNPEHSAGGLNFTINNWLYNFNTGERFQVRNGDLTVGETQKRGQWGLAQDNYGRLYYTRHSTWLFADILPGRGEYLLRSGDSNRGLRVEVAPDTEVYPVRVNPGTNRSYPGGPANHRGDGRLKNPTAVAGPTIYRGDAAPEAVGDAFSPDGAANVVGRFSISDADGGLELDATHERYDNSEWGSQEFLASSDEVFRPVNLRTGPDGALYVVDIYNGVFQHYRFLTDYFAEYMVQNDLHQTPPAGRIYRVYPEGADLSTPPPLDEQSPADLADFLTDPNGWTRDTAQRLLVQNGQTDAVPTLREIARSSDSDVGRIHALWTLHGLDAIDAESVFAAMEADNSHVVAAAIQTGEALLGTAAASAYVDRLVSLLDANHTRVVVQAAYSLGEVRESPLQSRAKAALGDLLERSTNSYVIAAVKSAPELESR